ncbi:MAG: ABC transporter ATP-binding protein, partial [Bacteroidales bacterium]
GLDPITAREINELILRIQNKYKASSIIITHDQKCAEMISNKMAILHDAHFIAQGSFEELKNNNKEEIRQYFY